MNDTIMKALDMTKTVLTTAKQNCKLVTVSVSGSIKMYF